MGTKKLNFPTSWVHHILMLWVEEEYQKIDFLRLVERITSSMVECRSVFWHILGAIKSIKVSEDSLTSHHFKGKSVPGISLCFSLPLINVYSPLTYNDISCLSVAYDTCHDLLLWSSPCLCVSLILFYINSLGFESHCKSIVVFSQNALVTPSKTAALDKWHNIGLKDLSLGK